MSLQVSGNASLASYGPKKISSKSTFCNILFSNEEVLPLKPPLQRHLTCLCLNREYTCPLCRQLANSVLPLPPQLGETTSLIPSKETDMNSIVNALSELLQANAEENLQRVERETQVRETQVRETQVRKTKVRETQERETQVEESERKIEKYFCL